MANSKKKEQPKKSSKPKKEIVFIDCEHCESSGLKDFNKKGRSELTELCPECNGSGKIEK
jgi:DnaJ-class molecular chaperone